MPPTSVVFFDFDGVILESVDIKTQAFRDLFSGHPEHVEEIVEFHSANAGMPRYDKFRHFYDNLLRSPMPAGEMERLDREFSSLVYERVVRCPLVPGALEFLKAYGDRLPLVVISATPETELKRIIAARGLGRYFKAAYGSPAKKTENLRAALGRLGRAPASAAFVGDGAQDYEAARALGMPFVARVTENTRDFWTRAEVPMIPDLNALAPALGLQP